jgi:hypothetical protein
MTRDKSSMSVPLASKPSSHADAQTQLLKRRQQQDLHAEKVS